MGLVSEVLQSMAWDDVAIARELHEVMRQPGPCFGTDEVGSGAQSAPSQYAAYAVFDAWYGEETVE